ncbi:MAG: phosphomannomutase/phosphoglucomutase [Methylobacter sp.]|nr:phosphomannomutase/phosphoglucomutase [Methylobacter sp.]
MARLFSLMSVIAVLMILIAGVGVYLKSAALIAQAKQDSADAIAKGVTLTLSEQIDLLNRMLDKMAQDPALLSAVASADPGLLTAAAANLEKHFPDALKIRLLLPGVSKLDEQSVPRMGYADLDMVRETFTKNQMPGIQGDNGPDRHLAMTRRIMQNGQVAGVILASLNFDFIGKIVQAAAVEDGYIELRQEKLVLGASGKKIDTEQAGNIKIAVPNTGWELDYHYIAGPDPGEFSLIAAIIIVPALIAMLAFFVGYRRLSGLLAQDLSSIMKAFKDMMSRKLQGNYPVNLNEMNAVISTLVQFKRVLDTEEDHETLVTDDDNFDLDGFFDESPDYGLNEGVVEDMPFNKTASLAKNNFIEPEIIGEAVPKIPEVKAGANKTDEKAAIFRAYDIRGIADKILTREVVFDIGRALGTDAKNQGCKAVVIGRDGRTSSPYLAEALAKGLVSTGQNVLDIGMVPTPVLYFVAQHTEGRSGVMVTGSHNPAEYNGLKMVINGETLAGERIQQLRQCIEKQVFATGETGSIAQNDRFVNEYIGTISEDIHIARPMLVVLDCGNGVAGKLGPVLLRTLGCEVIELFCAVDGAFPNHHPDPSKPENLVELIAAVKHYQADLGIAFDGDGDRLGVIDSNGKIIWPDRQMMLFAKDVLAGKPGAEIIYDVKCTRHLAGQIKKYGGRPLMWKTGHSFMKAKLKETGAKLAGEMSGHIFFNDRWFGFDDALYSAARLIEILSRDTRASAEVFAEFPDSINTPELNVALAEGENFAFMESLFSAADFKEGKITTIDGLRVDFPHGWGLVRASNTAPELAIRFEADSKEDLISIQEQFRKLMKKIKPDIRLPF